MAREKSKFAVVDFETSQWAIPLTWGYKDELNEFSDDNPTNPDSLLGSLFDVILRYRPKKVWGHNAGKFDWLFLLHYAQTQGWPMRASVKAGRIVYAEIFFEEENYRLKLYDSYAVAQAGLAKCADSFKLESGKFLEKEDYKIDALDWGREKRVKGALADCRVTYELLGVLEKQFTDWSGRLKATFSSSALSVLKAEIGEEFPMIPERVNIFARDGYYGGRVEVFEHAPQFRLSEWDINSSYPNAMTKPLPWRPSNSKTPLAMVEAWVTTPKKCDLPILAFRPANGGMYFPTGKWKGVYPLNEILYAREQGYKIEIVDYQYFERAPLEVADYIHKLYKLKMVSSGAEREFCKLCLNGSYGKMGQGPEVEDLIHFTTQSEADAYVLSKDPGAVKRMNPMQLWYIEKSIKWPQHTNFAFAAYVTAYSRIHLHELMRAADMLCYVDTDSIHARASSNYKTDDKALGALKLERVDFEGKYYAPKIYELHSDKGMRITKDGPELHHYASKGFPVNAKDFEQMVTGELVETKKMQLLKRQLRSASKVSHHGSQLPTVKKKWAMISPKRRIVGSGSTVPWSVEQLQRDEHIAQPTYFKGEK